MTDELTDAEIEAIENGFRAYGNRTTARLIASLRQARRERDEARLERDGALRIARMAQTIIATRTDPERERDRKETS